MTPRAIIAFSTAFPTEKYTADRYTVRFWNDECKSSFAFPGKAHKFSIIMLQPQSAFMLEFIADPDAASQRLYSQLEEDAVAASFNNNEVLLLLILPFLDYSTLATVAVTNKALLRQVRQRNELWEPLVVKLETEIVQPRFKYKFLRIPPRDSTKRSLLRINDGNELFELVCQERMYDTFKLDYKGDLQSIFHVSGTTIKFHIERTFPVYCVDCKVSCATQRELYHHCCEDSHIFQRCPELHDPRRRNDYDDLTLYAKAMALGHFRCRIERYFREAAMQPKNKQVFRGVTWRIIQQLEEWDSDETRRACFPNDPSIATVENVTAGCIQWATADYIAGNTTEAIMGAHQGYYIGWQSERFKRQSKYRLGFNLLRNKGAYDLAFEGSVTDAIMKAAMHHPPVLSTWLVEPLEELNRPYLPSNL